MKILFLLFSPPTGTWGSLTRVTAIASAASFRGDEVAFCASGTLSDRLRAAGLRVYSVPQATMFGLPLSVSRLMEKRSQRASLPVKEGRSIGSVWFVLKLSGMTGRSYLSRLVDAQLDAIERFRPDALFTEMDPGAFLTSRICGIDLFATYASVMEGGRETRTFARLMRTMKSILADHGVTDGLEGGPYHLKNVHRIVPSIPELEEKEPGGQSRDSLLFAGSLLGSFKNQSDGEYELEPNKKYVFVYVGTGSVSLDRLISVLPAVFPEGSETICLVGAQSIGEEMCLGNVVLRPYFDAERIIPRCDWVLCHGGHNTIMQSLTSGIPLLVFPGPIFERRFNASMVEKAGAGLMIELSSFKKETLLEAMKRRESCAVAARKLGERISSYDGPRIVLAEMARYASGGSRGVRHDEY
jgi:Glycosyl transferases, related to UDP-glucuronosyltransferase